jgi:hypothetical protein
MTTLCTLVLQVTSVHTASLTNPARQENVGFQQHLKVAEWKGFEPSRRFPACTLSRGVPSTTRPPLRRPL